MVAFQSLHISMRKPTIPMSRCPYNASKPSNYQIFYDANNLYGDVAGFARIWIRLDEPEYMDYVNVSKNAEAGYILEVDLEYPTGIHNQHNDYPKAPEKITV